MFYSIVHSQKVQPKSIELINFYLDSVSYDYLYTFDYENPIVLPDSIKDKVLAVLNGYIPPQKIKEESYIPDDVMKIIDNECEGICENDSLCFTRAKDSIINNMNNRTMQILHDKAFPENFLLAIGAWDVTEAVPILLKNLDNPIYPKEETLLALARLGNDSIMESILNKYTLEYVINNSEFKVNNPELIYHSNDRELIHDFFRAGMYIKRKNILLNMVDLIDIQGKTYFYEDLVPIEMTVTMWLSLLFINKEYVENGAFEELESITNRFYYSISNNLSTPKINEILSTENKKLVKQEIKLWITKNVEFN